jgi:hypothetical protein
MGQILQSMNLGGGIGAVGVTGTEGSGPREAPEPEASELMAPELEKCFVSCHQNPGENLADEDVSKFTRKYKPSSLLKRSSSFLSSQHNNTS